MPARRAPGGGADTPRSRARTHRSRASRPTSGRAQPGRKCCDANIRLRDRGRAWRRDRRARLPARLPRSPRQPVKYRLMKARSASGRPCGHVSSAMCFRECSTASLCFSKHQQRAKKNRVIAALRRRRPRLLICCSGARWKPRQLFEQAFGRPEVVDIARRLHHIASANPEPALARRNGKRAYFAHVSLGAWSQLILFIRIRTTMRSLANPPS